MVRHLAPPLFLALGMSCLAGCAKAHWTLAPHVPNPVLLGPVDRVGGHRASGGRSIANVDAEASSRATATTDDGVTVAAASNPIAQRLEGAAGNRSDVDVQVDDVNAGGYFFFAFGTASASEWVGIKGRAVAKEGVK